MALSGSCPSRPSAARAAAPTSSWRGGQSRSSPRAPKRASSRTWARRTRPSRSRRCAKRCASCSPPSTSSLRCCAGRSWPSITSTWRNGSSGSARFSARRARPSRSSRTSYSTDGVTSIPSETAGWFGHPRGLSTLFFTEMWERFSYYGMRAFLILYMTAPVAVGGLGFDVPRASSVYGTYTGSVWVTPILGGLVADRMLGAYRSVLLGGIVIALGHFTLALRALPFFYTGLSLIVVGTGLLKPNATTLVGSLYDERDARRDAGFSIFYMGINLGAFIGPLLAGGLAQKVDWHLGFACAGVDRKSTRLNSSHLVISYAVFCLKKKKKQKIQEKHSLNRPTTNEQTNPAGNYKAPAPRQSPQQSRVIIHH